MHNADIGSIGTNKTHVGSDGGPTLCNCRVKNEACRDNDFPHFVICAKYAKVAADLPCCLFAVLPYFRCRSKFTENQTKALLNDVVAIIVGKWETVLLRFAWSTFYCKLCMV